MNGVTPDQECDLVSERLLERHGNNLSLFPLYICDALRISKKAWIFFEYFFGFFSMIGATFFSLFMYQLKIPMAQWVFKKNSWLQFCGVKHGKINIYPKKIDSINQSIDQSNVYVLRIINKGIAGLIACLLPQKRDATIEIMGVALRNSVENDSELLVDFCRTLPGFSELSRPEQLRRISAKYSSAWLVSAISFPKILFKNSQLICNFNWIRNEMFVSWNNFSIFVGNSNLQPQFLSVTWTF